MRQEERYFTRIWKHDNWHRKPEGICPYDQSCVICYPAHSASLTKGFTDFWRIWIERRCQGHTYTRHTIDLYREAQESSNCEQVESIFTSLVETIRYQQHIPPASFETLVESLKFYWEITSRFGNWKVLYSNPSDTSSEDFKMTRPQDQQDVSASTIQGEALDDTDSGAKPLGEQDSDNDWTKKDDEYDTQYSIYNTSNQRGRGSFRQAQREEEETKQEHPVVTDISAIQIYMETSTYRKHLIVLFVPKEIREYDNPRLFGKSTNHENSSSE